MQISNITTATTSTRDNSLDALSKVQNVVQKKNRIFVWLMSAFYAVVLTSGDLSSHNGLIFLKCPTKYPEDSFCQIYFE
jgi:hypothetical protein